MTAREDRDDFDQRTRPYRPQLVAHSYRMLASIHDAEDAVQETYLQAWRAYDDFEGRSSVRTWLYRIATNVCLRALENRGRRAVPTGLGGPGQDPAAALTDWPELAWVEPAPDVVLGMGSAGSTDPLEATTRRQSVRLAFIAALQHLPARQRAVLVLRDVLVFSAGEVATMLDTTTTAVHSMLQRARARLTEVQPDENQVTEPDSVAQRDLLDRYVAAMYHNDIDGLVAVLSADAVWEMPPYPTWFRGAHTIGRMVAAQSPARDTGTTCSSPPQPTASPPSASTSPTSTACTVPSTCRSSRSLRPGSRTSSPSSGPRCSRGSASRTLRLLGMPGHRELEGRLEAVVASSARTGSQLPARDLVEDQPLSGPGQPTPAGAVSPRRPTSGHRAR